MKFFSSIQQKIHEKKIKHMLKFCGKNVVIEPGVIFIHPENISIGDNVQLRRGCMLYASNSTSSENLESTPYIIIGNNVHIKENALLNTYGGFIVFGDNVIIGQNSIVYGNGGVCIGNNSGLGPLSLVIASNHIFDKKDIPFVLQGETKQGIRIEDNVWCAGNITICDGVNIGLNAVIGAGTVIRKSVAANAVVLGNPQKTAYIHS